MLCSANALSLKFCPECSRLLRLAYTISAFAQRRNFLFTDFRLAATLVNASVSWSTTSFVNLSALYSSFSLLIRIELGVQGLYLFRDGQQNNFYRAVTAHGVGMVFLFIMPGIISAMGNLHVPTILGFVDFATPRLNNLAFWLSVLSVSCWSLPWRLRLVFQRDGLSIFL